MGGTGEAAEGAEDEGAPDVRGKDGEALEGPLDVLRELPWGTGGRRVYDGQAQTAAPLPRTPPPPRPGSHRFQELSENPEGPIIGRPQERVRASNAPA